MISLIKVLRQVEETACIKGEPVFGLCALCLRNASAKTVYQNDRCPLSVHLRDSIRGLKKAQKGQKARSICRIGRKRGHRCVRE